MFIAIPISQSEKISLIFISKDSPKSIPPTHLQQLCILYFYTTNPVIRLADFMCGMGFYFLKDKFKEIKFANLLHLVIVIGSRQL